MSNIEMNKKAIEALAILKTNYDHSTIDGKRIGYLENFVLLLVNLVHRKKYTSIKLDSLEDIQKDFINYYGFKLPVIILRTILSKAKKLGFFIKEHRELKPIEAKINKVISNDTDADARREVGSLLKSIKKFAKKVFDQKITEEDIEESLIAILSRHSLDILYFYEEENFQEKGLLPEVSKKNPTVEFIIYKYIEKIEKSDYQIYRVFEKVAVGYALLNAVVYSGASFQEGTLQKINVFLDTRPVLRILGIEGDERKNNYLEFLDYINKHSKGITLYILDKHYDEILHIFEQAKIVIDSGRIDYAKTSMAMRYFIDNNMNASDIEEFIGSLETKLEQLGIKKYTKFEYLQHVHDFQIDESKLQDKIAEVYKKYDFRFILTQSKEEAIAVDASMIAQVMAMKKNKVYRNFSDIEYLFITSNIGLALASKYFEKEEFELEASFIPTCVTDFFFFTLLWVNNEKNEFTNGNNIDTRIITRTLLAFNPDKKLYEKYYQELRKLKERGDITSEQYTLLCSRQALESMEERTLSDYEAISDKLPFEIIDEIERKADEKYLLEKREHESTQLKYQAELERQELKVNSISKVIYSLFETIVIILGFVYFYFAVDSIKAMIENKSPNIYGSIFIFVVGFIGLSIFDFFSKKPVVLEKIKKFIKNILYEK